MRDLNLNVYRVLKEHFIEHVMSLPSLVLIGVFY